MRVNAAVIRSARSLSLSTVGGVATSGAGSGATRGGGAAGWEAVICSAATANSTTMTPTTPDIRSLIDTHSGPTFEPLAMRHLLSSRDVPEQAHCLRHVAEHRL